MVQNLNFYGMIQCMQMIFIMVQNLSFFQYDTGNPNDFYNGTIILCTHFDFPVVSNVYLDCPSDSFAHVICQEHGLCPHALKCRSKLALNALEFRLMQCISKYMHNKTSKMSK